MLAFSLNFFELNWLSSEDVALNGTLTTPTGQGGCVIGTPSLDPSRTHVMWPGFHGQEYQ